MVDAKKFNISKVIKSLQKADDATFDALLSASKEYPLKFIPYIHTFVNSLSVPNPKIQRKVLSILLNLAFSAENSLVPYLDVFIKFLDSPNDLIKEDALLVVEQISKKQPNAIFNYFEKICILIVDVDPKVRLYSIMILFNLSEKDPKKIAPLFENLSALFDDPDQNVRDAIVMLFSNMTKSSITEVRPYLKQMLSTLEKTSENVQKRIIWTVSQLIKTKPEIFSEELDLLLELLIKKDALQNLGLKLLETVAYQLPDRLLPYIEKMWEKIDQGKLVQEYGSIIAIVLINYPGTLAKYVEKLSDLFKNNINSILSTFTNSKDEERLKSGIIMAIIEIYHIDSINEYVSQLNEVLDEFNYVKKSIEKVKELKGLNVFVPKELATHEVSVVSKISSVEKKGDKIETGVKEIDYLLYGGLPERSLISFQSSSCDERDVMLSRIMETALKKDLIVVYVSSQLKSENENYYTIYCTADKVNVVKKDTIIASDEGATSINLAIARILMNTSDEKRKLVIIENLSKLFLVDQPALIIRFLKALSSKLKEKNGTVLGIVNPALHPPEVLAQLTDSVDGDIEIFEESHESVIERFLRVNKMLAREYKSEVVKIDKNSLIAV